MDFSSMRKLDKVNNCTGQTHPDAEHPAQQRGYRPVAEKHPAAYKQDRCTGRQQNKQ
jgi:hypothetical protein